MRKIVLAFAIAALISAPCLAESDGALQIVISDPEGLLPAGDPLVGELIDLGGFKMRVVTPDAGIDYKLLVVKPDPAMRFSMIVIDPRTGRELKLPRGRLDELFELLERRGRGDPVPRAGPGGPGP